MISRAKSRSMLRNLGLWNSNTQTLIALAGNKSDLEANRQVDREVAQNYANEMGILFMETSAKSGQNVNEIFQNIAEKLPKQSKEDEDKSRSGFTVGGNQGGARSGAGCCGGS